MKVSKIVYDEKKSLFNVTIEEDKSFLISYELYEELELKIEQEITVDTYNKLEEESSYQTAKKIAENFINYKMRTEQEVVNKLYSHTKNMQVINKVIEYYRKLNLLDDNRYAREFISTYMNYKKSSKKMTGFKLQQKGINNKVISKYLDEIDDELELENAKELYEKKFSNIDLSDFKQKQKAYRFLASKGFSYDIINRIIE